jgi:hypothetical protein
MVEETDASERFSDAELDRLNKQAIKNEFFTPDVLYADITLFKDVIVGAIYTDILRVPNNQVAFDTAQTYMASVLPNYQTRFYDGAGSYFDPIGYNQTRVDSLLTSPDLHVPIFLTAPSTYFFDYFLRQLALNINHSGPAEKFTKRHIDKHHYVKDKTPVTLILNLFPLVLPIALLTKIAEDMGEGLGVNITCIAKDPALFDESDWSTWMKTVDCFFLSSLGRFCESEMTRQKQTDLEFMGRHIFARKQFPSSVEEEMKTLDIEHQIQLITAQIGVLCDFHWIQNNDVRLTGDRQSIGDHDHPQEG